MAQATSKPSRPLKTDSASGMMGGTSKTNKTQGLITSILLVVIIGSALWFLGSRGSNAEIVLNTEWQAVFLDNGQVYFGKVTNITDRTVKLEDIYYLQVINQPLQRTVEDGEQPAQAQQEQRLTLFKLGNEIHGPHDTMFINRDHVVLIEDLKEEGQVVRAIRDYMAGGSQQQQQQQQQPIE